MKPEIPFNPFKEDLYPPGKDPMDMSLEELELLLYSKRLELKIDLDNLQKKINYSKIIIDVLQSLGVQEKIEKFYNSIMDPPPSSPPPKKEESG